ncbi:MAG: hypothetical protein ACRCSX_12865 [Allorhizobium sp.]
MAVIGFSPAAWGNAENEYGAERSFTKDRVSSKDRSTMIDDELPAKVDPDQCGASLPDALSPHKEEAPDG